MRSTRRGAVQLVLAKGMWKPGRGRTPLPMEVSGRLCRDDSIKMKGRFGWVEIGVRGWDSEAKGGGRKCLILNGGVPKRWYTVSRES